MTISLERLLKHMAWANQRTIEHLQTLPEDSLKSYADYLLSMFILSLSWNVFVYLLIYYGLIIEVPYLFKSATPLAYLIPPLGYLYTRAVLYNERKIKLLDLSSRTPCARMSHHPN